MIRYFTISEPLTFILKSVKVRKMAGMEKGLGK